MNTISGTSGNDTLTGTGASDYLDGGTGNDAMSGLAGDDVYIVGEAGDTVTENASEGTDRINATVSYTLGANVENLWLVGTATISGIGNTLGNVLWGNGSDNSLSGLAGNDYLDGGVGADTMLGGAGDDTFWVDNAGDVVTENAAEGSDAVNSTLSAYTLTANVESLTLVSGAGNINGTGNGLDNAITGNEGNNVLDGLAGSDSLNGGTGADTMTGGAGDDTYWVDNAGDVVTESPDDGSDTVYSTLAAYVLPGNVENLVLGTNYAGTENLDGTGNGLANSLRGNSGNNVLAGGGGDDTLTGGSGNDTLTGGSGNDVFYISTSDSGTDTITDLAVGDVIQVCGAFFFTGSVGQGNGSALNSGEVQLASSGGQTILYIGTDATPGADVSIALNGSYAASNFYLSGFEIRYDTNHAPTLGSPVADQAAVAGSAYSFQVPAGAFADADGDSLAYSAAVLDIDWGFAALPSWLTFDAATRTFSGTPGVADVGSLDILLSAADGSAASAADDFVLTVSAAAADTTAPSVLTFSPADEASGVAVAANVTLTFNEAIQVGTGTILLKNATGSVVETFDAASSSRISISGSTLTINPTADLGYGTGYRVEFAAGSIKDLAGNSYAGTTSYNFTTVAAPDTSAPTVLTFSPADEAVGVALAANIILTFNEAIQGGTGSILLRNASGTLVETLNPASSSNVSILGAALTINPSADLSYGSGYSVELAAGSVKDLAGNSYAGTTDYNFTTLAAPDTSAPTVLSFSPADEATGIGLADNLAAIFSEAIQAGTGSIVLRNASGSVVETFDAASSSRISISGSTLSINPSADLACGTGYKVEFAAGSVKDLAGNGYAGTSSYNFTTSEAPVLAGTAGNDTIAGTAGNDTIEGGSGIDIGVFRGSLANYTLIRTGTTCVVRDNTGADGTDTVIDVESLRFADKIVNLSVQDVAAAAPPADVPRLEELYVAFFNRVPDADGLCYWIGQLKDGRAVDQIAESFYSAGVQYSSLTGFSASMSNADFVNVVYRNVLGRSAGADAEGLAYWSDKLASGAVTHSSLVSSILGSAHTFKGNTTWGWVADLLDNKIAVANRFAVDWGLNYSTPSESIAQGMAIAAAVTPAGTAEAIALIGVSGVEMHLA